MSLRVCCMSETRASLLFPKTFSYFPSKKEIIVLFIMALWIWHQYNWTSNYKALIFFYFCLFFFICFLHIFLFLYYKANKLFFVHQIWFSPCLETIFWCLICTISLVGVNRFWTILLCRNPSECFPFYLCEKNASVYHFIV